MLRAKLYLSVGAALFVALCLTLFLLVRVAALLAALVLAAGLINVTPTRGEDLVLAFAVTAGAGLVARASSKLRLPDLRVSWHRTRTQTWHYRDLRAAAGQESLQS